MSGKSGRSVMYVHAGRMIGGNTSFVLLGSCQNVGGEIVAEISTQRHNASRTYPALFESDEVSMRMRGRLWDGAYRFRGEVTQEPGKELRVLMAPFTTMTSSRAGR